MKRATSLIPVKGDQRVVLYRDIGLAAVASLDSSLFGDKSACRWKSNLKQLSNTKPSELTTNKQVSCVSKINAITGTNKRFKAGQLQNYLAEWQKITSDPFILQCVTNCQIEFDYILSPSSSMTCLHPEYKFSIQEQHAIDCEIGKFLDKQVIELSESETGQIISPTLPNAEKSYFQSKTSQPIRDLRKLRLNRPSNL